MNTDKSAKSEWFYHGAILASALFFALSTLLAKFAVHDNVSTWTVTFMRFFIGFLVILAYLPFANTPLEPRNVWVLVFRGVSNWLAVYLFYLAIRYTTITNANLLNLTYPVFVALLAPLFLREYLKLRDWFVLAMAGAGIYLVVNPNFQHVNIGDLIGLAGGVTAGFAIIALCFARKDNHTVTVLLVMLGVGTILSAPAVFTENFTRFSGRTWIILIACGTTGVAGQFAITAAFKHLSAFAGSITGMARVVMAAILGFFFLAEIPTWNVVAGSIVLFTAIALLSGSGKNIQLERKAS